jgi:stage II sporulation protein AA (anti-sigma F factor antagonist)
MNRARAGKDHAMDEPDPSVEVTVTEQDTRSAGIRVVGELTEAARRPVVRVVTDLMLNAPHLHHVRLDTCGVTFLNSAGVSVLVQVQKMLQPRGIELTLEVQSAVVARPLQLSGLWRRFTIVDRREDTPEHTHEAMPPGIEHR